MNGAPLASIVIPVYNGERFLPMTLLSVLRQTYPNTQIICVDDGSTDGTPKLLSDAAAAHENVVVTKQPNGGVAAARNRGISLARGDFVSFIDADDLWHPEKLASEIAALERSGPAFGVAYSLSRRINLADEVVGRKHCHLSHQGDVLEFLMMQNIVGNCSAFTVRKCYLDRTAGFDSSLRTRNAEGCEDWKLLCQLAQICKFVIVPRYLVGYRRHPAAMSGNLGSMRRSWRFVFEDLRKDGLTLPRHRARTRRGMHELWYLRVAFAERTLTARELGSFFRALQSPQSAWLTIKWLAKVAYRGAGRSFRRRKRPASFDEMLPEQDAPSCTRRPCEMLHRATSGRRRQ